MFTFRGATEDSKRLARQILRLLRDRHAMHIGKLRMRPGTDGTFVQAELEEMMDRGEVERVRTLGYAREDCDFLRVNRPTTVSKETSDKWVLQAVQTGRDHMRLAGEATACLAD